MNQGLDRWSIKNATTEVSKMEKPEDWSPYSYEMGYLTERFGKACVMMPSYLTSQVDDIRAFAAWLLKAADWLESEQEKNKRR